MPLPSPRLQFVQSLHGWIVIPKTARADVLHARTTRCHQPDRCLGVGCAAVSRLQLGGDKPR